MSVDNKLPEIRFKGFSEEWIERDLKSFSASFSYGLNASAIKFDGVNKYLRITDIDEKSRRFDYSQLTSPDADLSKSDHYLLKNGDILFARTGASVGKTYIYNEQDGKVYFAGFLIRASINHNTSAQFVFQNTQTHKYARFVAATSQRSGQPGINAKEYGEYRLFSPTEPEQTKIGSYFQKLDALINQHQQKHDKLSNIKKAMLEKMFPKQGETIPEIRFKGFSGEWKISELSRLALFNPKAELPESFKYVDLESVKGTSLIGYKIESRDSAPSRAQRLAQKGDVFYQTVRPYQKNNYLFHGFENDYVFSTGYAQLRPYFDGNFLLNLVQRDSFVKCVLDNCTGTSYPAINASALATLEVSYPESEVEQTQIGNYLQKLDALINQHQQQITKLNNIKQACLSKMFV